MNYIQIFFNLYLILQYKILYIFYLMYFRHLLSDQTDPFNRSPLTMDMVKSNVELQQKIQEWISQKKLEKALRTDT